MYMRLSNTLRTSIRRFSTPAVVTEEAQAAFKTKSVPKVGLDEFGRGYGTGRRKASSARVWLADGSGQFTINNRCCTNYFQPIQREQCILPFMVTKTAGLFDVKCTVKGGGMSGQAGAIRLGISRALVNFIPELKSPLRQAGFMTRDSRKVERKKPGLKKARKQYQWVKR